MAPIRQFDAFDVLRGRETAEGFRTGRLGGDGSGKERIPSSLSKDYKPRHAVRHRNFSACSARLACRRAIY